MRHAFGWQLMDIHCHFVFAEAVPTTIFVQFVCISFAMHLNERKLSHDH